MNSIHPLKLFSATVLIAIIGTSTFTGCSARKTPDSISTARFAISEAQKNDSIRFASSELNLAQQKLSSAEEAMRHRDYTLARRFSEQATVDAAYAQAKAEAVSATVRAEQTTRAADSLKIR
jgi:hypothetical protein